MKKINSSNVPVNLYIEDPTHMMPRIYLDDLTYAKAIESLVIVGTDIMIVQRSKGVAYLVKRRAKPVNNWWIIGGRSFAGENPIESAQRCFKRETMLDMPQERFQLMAINRYHWKDRQQEPQNVGSDNLIYTFIIDLSNEEIKTAANSLDSAEYQPGSLTMFDHQRLTAEDVHPALIDIFKNIFSK